MAEEQHCEQSSAPRLCANNCGFFANSATLNLCSKCYRDHVLKEKQSEKMDALLSSTDASVKPMYPFSFSLPPAADSGEVRSVSVGSSAAVPEPESKGPSRCGACRKRVGLIGFKCKCGTTYCGSHRYPEQHSCTFDFKAVGKKAIAKANPVIKAAKLEKI